MLEGGCSVPVGVESTLEELDSADISEADPIFSAESFDVLEPDSPMLWFSGIVESSHRLPSSLPSTPGLNTPTADFHTGAFPLVRTLPPLRKRLARLSLKTCVTSLDGSSQVVYAPPPVLVRNYQEAERFGEICARKTKELGGKDILDEVGRVRRERERKDLERAIEKSRQEAGKRKREGAGEEDEHQGLQGLVQILHEEGMEKKQKQ